MFNHPENEQAQLRTEAEDSDIIGYFSIIIAHAIPESLRPRWNEFLREFRVRICAEARPQIDIVRREKKGESREFTYQQKMRFFLKIIWPAIELALEQPKYQELINQTFKKKWQTEEGGKYDLFQYLSDQRKGQIKGMGDVHLKAARRQAFKTLDDPKDEAEVMEELGNPKISSRASRVVFHHSGR